MKLHPFPISIPIPIPIPTGSSSSNTSNISLHKLKPQSPPIQLLPPVQAIIQPLITFILTIIIIFFFFFFPLHFPITFITLLKLTPLPLSHRINSSRLRRQPAGFHPPAARKDYRPKPREQQAHRTAETGLVREVYV